MHAFINGEQQRQRGFKEERPAHQAIAVSQALRAGIVIALIGCTESPDRDSPYRHLQEIVETTKRWLGIRPRVRGIDPVKLSQVDRHKGRIRRRAKRVSSRAVVPEALRRTLSEAIGAPNMTKGVHVAAVELYAAEDGGGSPPSTAVTVKDGRAKPAITSDQARKRRRVQALVDELQ